jgi:hypothetical protein
MSARSALVEYLTTLVAATPELEDVRVIPTTRTLGELSKPVLIVKTNSLSKIPAAPRAGFIGSFTLTLVSPHQDLDLAEDDLEARLEVLLPALFTWGLLWESADQAQYDENRICYDIQTTSILNK